MKALLKRTSSIQDWRVKSMTKTVKQVCLTTCASILLLSNLSLQTYAKGGDFAVDLSSYETKQETSVEFTIDTDDYKLAKEKKIRITFPSQFQVPKKIDEEDISLNGEEPDEVTVSGKTITLTVPSELDGEKDIEIEISEDAGIETPSKGGEYTITVSAEFIETEKRNGKEYKKTVRETYKSDEFEIEDDEPSTTKNNNGSSTNKPQPTPQPIPQPKPVPTPAVEQREVIVHLGSTVGYYKTTLNGKENHVVSTLEAAPFMVKGYTLVPLRFITTALGGKAVYDPKTGNVGITLGSKYTELKAGSNVAIVNGQAVKMPVAPAIINKRTMVPLRFLSESLGCKVEWIPATQTIRILK
jgi:predicted Rdx family selenoprotein